LAGSCENLVCVELHINGEAREFAVALSLAALIEMLGMKSDRVAVELNHDIVHRERWSATLLKDGDCLEIVHFVGGGLDRPQELL
jgi:thiamine biosynthesis protein ThiS